MTGVLTLLLPIALAISVVLTPTVRALALRRGLLDSPGAQGHTKELRPIPNVGGVAIVIAIVAPMLAGLAMLNTSLADAIVRSLPALEPNLRGVRSHTPLALSVIAALLVLHILGFIDDRRSIGAMPKLIVMTLVTGVVVVAFDVRLLTALDAHAGGSWLSICLTIAWIVGITNAFNFLDNMDGLAAGVASVAAGMFLVAATLNEQWFVGAVLFLLLGSLLGFLVFNFPPASVFMGDGGSLPVGFLLAFLTVRTTYFGGDVPNAWYAVFMPLCVLAIPLYDLISVSAIRIAQGKSPFVGDQQHFSHRMRARGLTTKQTLAIIYGCTAITGIAGILLGQVGGWQALLIGIQILLVLCLIGLFEYAARPASEQDA